jgi:hypothetical protein
MNGFPHGDFHRDVVKHEVYHPNWCRSERLAYTVDLIHLLAALVPAGGEGSISTLPLGWRGDVETEGDLARAAANLREAAQVMAEIEQRTGTLIHLDLEPEPGCRLQESADVVEFFERRLLADADRTLMLRHLRVCHDVCHAAVMFEDQEQVLAAYERRGILVGKVQVSSALHVELDDPGSDAGRAQLEELAAFREPRYLHQAVWVAGPKLERRRFFDDLPEAIEAARRGELEPGRLRVHFHVPVFLESIGALGTTQSTIGRCLRLMEARPEVRHFEVETYAWEVLPRSLQAGELAEGIAREMAWVSEEAGAGWFA